MLQTQTPSQQSLTVEYIVQTPRKKLQTLIEPAKEPIKEPSKELLLGTIEKFESPKPQTPKS